jgi:hypothetical protein
LTIAFIVSFDEWGYGNNFDFSIGLGYFIRAIFIVAIVIGLQVVVTKLQALQWGFRAEFKLWWYGIFIGLGLAFFSGSLTNDLGESIIVWFLAPGGIFFHHMVQHRLGWFRYGLNMRETGMCCMLGSLSTIFLAVIIKFMMYFFDPAGATYLFLEKLMSVSLWYSLFSFLPIPPLNGSRVFFWSRLAYMFLLGTIIGAVVLLLTPLNIFWTLILSLLLGALIWALQLVKVEMP